MLSNLSKLTHHILWAIERQCHIKWHAALLESVDRYKHTIQKDTNCAIDEEITSAPRSVVPHWCDCCCFLFLSPLLPLSLLLLLPWIKFYWDFVLPVIYVKMIGIFGSYSPHLRTHMHPIWTQFIYSICHVAKRTRVDHWRAISLPFSLSLSLSVLLSHSPTHHLSSSILHRFVLLTFVTKHYICANSNTYHCHQEQYSSGRSAHKMEKKYLSIRILIKHSSYTCQPQLMKNTNGKKMLRRICIW